MPVVECRAFQEYGDTTGTSQHGTDQDLQVFTQLSFVPFYLRVKPEVNYGVNTDGHLGEHDWNGKNVEGQGGLWCVASYLCYGAAGIRKPAENVRQQLEHQGLQVSTVYPAREGFSENSHKSINILS